MVSVIVQPAKFTPAGNKIIFQVQSDLPNISYFKVELLEATSSATIDNFNIYTTPKTPQSSHIDFSRILSSFVRWQVNNSLNVLSLPITKSIIQYTLKVTEMGVTNGILKAIGTTYTLPNTYYTWNADMERANFRNYNMNNYLVSNGLPAKFLTKKPDGGKVNDDSTEQLYFMHDGEDVLIAEFKTYSKNGTLLNIYNHNITGLDQSKIIRLQASPKAMFESLLADFTNVDHYTVQVVDENGKAKTEMRTFYYQKLPCNLEPVNLLWVNSLGGLDTYQFVNVQETINYTRNTIKKNPYDIYNGEYTDNTGDILNATEEVIDVNQSGSYTVTSRIITDAESYWLAELFKSKQVFVELADEALIPVLVTNNNYQIQRQKYNKQAPNTIQVTYQMTDDVIPHDAMAYGGIDTGKAQLEFINEQMNTDLDFDTILLFGTSVTDGKEGIGGAVASINAKQMFEFNKITPLLGLTQNMTIRVQGVEVMVIDFLADYLHKQFRYTHTNGTEYIGTFKSGFTDFN